VRPGTAARGSQSSWTSNWSLSTDGSRSAEARSRLVIENDDGSLEIIDWKTDNVAGSAVATRLESYHLQAGLYVLGLEAATGRRVSRVTYVFITAGQELSPGDPVALAAEASEAILMLASS